MSMKHICKMSVWDGTDPEDMGTHRFPLFILCGFPHHEGMLGRWGPSSLTADG